MKKLSFAISILALVIFANLAHAQASHEYSPVVEKTVNYKNWKLPNITSAKDEDWRNDAPVAAKLYEKYKAQVFQVIGISEYANSADTVTFFGEKDPPYPVVSESISRDDKQKTAHYEYRQLTGDTRNWGSPWHIFLEPDKLNKTGEVLAEKAFVVNGELVEDEVDKF